MKPTTATKIEGEEDAREVFVRNYGHSIDASYFHNDDMRSDNYRFIL